MASTYSGTKFFTKTSVNATTSLDFILTVAKKSSSTANNSSVITIRAYLYYHGGVSDVNSSYSTFKVDGTTVKSGSYSASLNDYLLLGSVDKTVTHNADGSFPKTAVTYSVNSYHWQTQSSGTAYVPAGTIATIARASTITSATNVNVPGNCGITWTPLSTSFYYKIKFTISNTTIHTTSAIHPSTTSSYTYSGYSIDTSIGEYITQSTQGSVTATLYTYSDSACTNQVGTASSKIFTVTLPSDDDSTKPSFSLILSIDNEDNTTLKSWGLCVAGYSKVNLYAIPSLFNSASISSYTISGGTYSQNVNGSTLDYTGGVITSSGTKTFNVVARDSRGVYSNTITRTVESYAYKKPTITNFSVSRSTSNTSQVSISANWSYSSVNSKNKVRAELKRKARNTSSYTTISTVSLGTTTSLSYTDTVSSEMVSYDYQLIVTDSLGESATGTSSSSTASVLLDFKAGGKGLAVGKISESNKFEVGISSEFISPVVIKDSTTINGVTTINPTLGSATTKALDVTGLIYQNGSPILGRIDFNVTDLNNCTTTGLYYIQSTSASNKPVSTNGWLEVIAFSSSRLLQRFTPQPTANCSTYIRRYATDGWSTWEKIVTNTDILNAVKGAGVQNITVTIQWGTKNRYIASVDTISGVVNIFMSIYAPSTVLSANSSTTVAYIPSTYAPPGSVSNLGTQTITSSNSSAPCTAWIIGKNVTNSSNWGKILIRPTRNTVSGEEIEINLSYNYLATLK